MLTELEQYDEAEQLFRAAIAHRLKLLGKVHRDTALAKGGLVALYLDTGRYYDAQPLANEVLATLSKVGVDRTALEAILQFQEGVLLANYLNNPGRGREKIPCIPGTGPRRGWPPPPICGLSLVELGLLLAKRQLHEAEEQFAETIAIARERVGLAHPELFVVAPHLAQLLQRRLGQQANALFEEILVAHQKRFGRQEQRREQWIGTLRKESSDISKWQVGCQDAVFLFQCIGPSK